MKNNQMDKTHDDYVVIENELFEIISNLKTIDECKAFFSDLCTDKEIEQMVLRAYAAKLFKEKLTYAQITEKTKLSSTTISRVNRCLHYGSGGYREFIRAEEKD